MNKVLEWFHSKNITSHSIAAAVLAFCAVYDSSAEVRTFIAELFVGCPIVVTKLGIFVTHVLAASAIWAKYSHSSSTSGTLDTAAKIYDKKD